MVNFNYFNYSNKLCTNYIKALPSPFTPISEFVILFSLFVILAIFFLHNKHLLIIL